MKHFSERCLTIIRGELLINSLIVLFLSAGFSSAQAVEKIKIVTTFTILADIVKNVAKEKAEIRSIIKPGAGIHDYQPTPKDIVNVQDADLILWNGLNLERWFKKFFYDVKNVPSVVVSEGINPISIYEGAYSGLPNPHVWMSLTNSVIYVENIKAALSKYDSANANYYEVNAKEYIKKINVIKKKAIKSLAYIPAAQRFLVTSEGAFSYLVKDIEFKELYLWPVNAESQGTSQQVRRLIDKIKQNNIPVVFSESTVPDKPAKQVAKETGALYGGILYVDSLSEINGDASTYLDMLEFNINNIIKSFNKALKQ